MLRDERFLIGVVLLVALFTRFHDLGGESLWLDEATTFHRSRLTLEGLVRDAENKHHIPTYFLLMHFYLALGIGDSELMLRLPSAIFGVLKVLAVYGIGRTVGGRVLGLVAALVIALNPCSVQYDQEARMYAMYCLAASLAVWGLLWLVQHPAEAARPLHRSFRRAADAATRQARRAWLLLAFGLLLALYSHGTSALFVISCSAVALAFIVARSEERWRFALNYLLTNVVVIVAFMPWLWHLVRQIGVVVHMKPWISHPTQRIVWRYVEWVFLFGHGLWLNVVVLALALLGSFALRRQALALVSLWVLTLLGPGLVLLASLREPIFLTRTIVWSVAPFAVLVAAGLLFVRPVAVRVLSVAAFALFAGRALHLEYYAPVLKPRWYDGIRLVQRDARRGAKVLTTAQREARLLEYYFSRKTRPLRRFEYVAVDDVAKLPKAIEGATTVWTIEGRSWAPAKAIRAKLAHMGKPTRAKRLGRSVRISRFALGEAAKAADKAPAKKHRRKHRHRKTSRPR